MNRWSIVFVHKGITTCAERYSGRSPLCADYTQWLSRARTRSQTTSLLLSYFVQGHCCDFVYSLILEHHPLIPFYIWSWPNGPACIICLRRSCSSSLNLSYYFPSIYSRLEQKHKIKVVVRTSSANWAGADGVTVDEIEDAKRMEIPDSSSIDLLLVSLVGKAPLCSDVRTSGILVPCWRKDDASHFLAPVQPQWHHVVASSKYSSEYIISVFRWVHDPT